MGASHSVRSYYRMYVVLRYPLSVDGRVHSLSQEKFTSLLQELRKHFPEYAITLSAMAYDHYCCHAEVESDPSEPPRPTLLVEVCSTVQPSTAQGGQLIEAVSDILNPEGTYHVEAVYNQSLRPF